MHLKSATKARGYGGGGSVQVHLKSATKARGYGRGGSAQVHRGSLTLKFDIFIIRCREK